MNTPLVSSDRNGQSGSPITAMNRRQLLHVVARSHLALMETHGISLRTAHKLHTDCRFFGWRYSLAAVRRGIAQLSAERLARAGGS